MYSSVLCHCGLKQRIVVTLCKAEETHVSFHAGSLWKFYSPGVMWADGTEQEIEELILQN